MSSHDQYIRSLIIKVGQELDRRARDMTIDPKETQVWLLQALNEIEDIAEKKVNQ